MSNATLIVKCFKCKNTYDVDERVVVTMESVVDPDTGVFIQYDVEFHYPDGGDPVYIQDLLCLPKHCSVFGRLPDGRVFAFPWLVKAKTGDGWHSRPDKNGQHYATRTLAQQEVST